MMALQVRPLSGPPPADVPLPRSPLARVIAQVRFAPILAIRSPDKVAVFQEIIRATYPILNQDRIQHIVITPGGTPNLQEGLIWRFSDQAKQPRWRISLGVDFIALETSAYVSRRDFINRLQSVISGLEVAFKPGDVQRFGMRYINRMVDEAVARVADLIRPKILGIAWLNDEPPSNLGESVTHLLTEAQLLAEEGQIQARWGSIPKGSTYDPDALEALSEPSWVLDLDMFTQSQQAFVSDELIATATSFAERIYMVFREMVTDDFLRFYGGEL
jgi:uncharacterized protein (TIGR04255 family)